LLKVKSDNDSCEYDFEDSLGNVLNKRYDREERAYNNLSKKYDNLDDFPEKEYNSLMHKETEKIYQEDESEDARKKGLLRTIKTFRGKEEIKNAINSGQKVYLETSIWFFLQKFQTILHLSTPLSPQHCTRRSYRTCPYSHLSKKDHSNLMNYRDNTSF